MSDNNLKTKKLGKVRRRRTRQRIRRVSTRPRLTVFRSSRHIYAQIISDKDANTVASASTMQKEFRDIEDKTRGIEAAKWVGKKIAERAKEIGIKQVVFDKGQYMYHGRVKALAESAREAGLEF